jgi:hypothetical protein
MHDIFIDWNEKIEIIYWQRKILFWFFGYYDEMKYFKQIRALNVW